MATTDIYHIVGSIQPSRHAAKFIATGDQAIVIDAFAVTRVAAGDTTGTISAWVNIPDITGDYGIISAGDTAAIEFLTLRVTAGKVVVELNDATADKFEHTTDNVISPHQWHHIAVVQDGVKPKLYIDGKKAAQTQTLGTDNTLWFGALALTDDASIGAAEEAGAAGQIRECKGAISDVKYWKNTLTAKEIEMDYEGKKPSLLGQSAGVSQLTNWWDMDGDYIDSVAAENGTAGASILLCNEYSEFSSRLSFMTGTPVDEDNVSISVADGAGHCVVIKAA